jgi:hypothetical protein
MGVALPGLTAGLLIVLLTVLWGRFDARKTGPATPPTAEKQFLAPSVQVIPSVAPRATIEAVPAVSDQPAAPAPAAKFAASPTPDAQLRQNDLIAQASQRIESGDVAGAREILLKEANGSEGPVFFALAETYDPNMLSAWGARAVAPDVKIARELYRKALSLGVASAHGRLEALE